jgi:hypothetical protein
MEMAAKLHRAWRIPADCLISEQPVGSAFAQSKPPSESGRRKPRAKQAPQRKVKKATPRKRA